MVKRTRHYKILKYVFCDIIGRPCTDDHDVTARLTPNCINCDEYKRWKKSGLSIKEHLKKDYEDYLDESVPGWRGSR